MISELWEAFKEPVRVTERLRSTVMIYLDEAQLFLEHFPVDTVEALAMSNSRRTDLTPDRTQESHLAKGEMGFLNLICGDKGIRTPDLLHAMQTRYQLRHTPKGLLSDQATY